MSTSTEFEIKVSGGNILLPKNLPDGIYRRVREVETPTVSNQEKVFVRIPVTELSINEPWFKYHKPKTRREKELKERIKTAIEKGLKDFWRPKYDPSFSNEEHTEICYCPGKEPALCKKYSWWEKNAKKFLPKCKSRLGTVDEYFLFIAVLIKKLVASGWSIEKTWDAVCYDSKELGNYYNSSDSIENIYENTGSREVCGFYDLANTYKILTDGDTYCLVSGSIDEYSYKYSLADIYHCDGDNYGTSSTGWIVLEKDPYTTK